MKELAGRLSALDPQASESLKVIAYFDALVHGRVGIEGVLRGAAVLSGTAVGRAADDGELGRRFGADGGALPRASALGWPSARADDGSVLWIERTGVPHANDALVLERLTLAVSVTSMRLDAQAPSRRAIDVLLSEDATAEQRTEASARLLLPALAPSYLIAVPAGVLVDRSLPQATIASSQGIVRAVISATDETTAASAGIGTPAFSPAEMRDSWRHALIALRLTDATTPVARAADLGVLLHVLEAEDSRSTVHPDVRAIGRATSGHWHPDVLHALAAGASQRTLAQLAGVHHSTMAVRLQELPALLGYDPQHGDGRTRLAVALLLHRAAAVTAPDPAATAAAAP